MAARKLQQEVDKCFKKVAEGVAEFEGIYEKIEQSNNPAQKEKLEDNLKREIKKLQRLRDQIKTWAASNDIKDKAPLLEQRKLIETQMEKFKAVEKAMKTKAYSKEGLSAAAKLDPKEQAKLEAGEFLSSMVDELEQQIEALEAESESIQATMKKGKSQGAKAERMAEIERVIERHKWHQGKLELIRRSLENGGVEAEQVNDLEENIRYYISDGNSAEYMGDEDMYEDLDLEDDEGTYGMAQDNEKNSSQDAQSVQEDLTPDPELAPAAPAAAAAAASSSSAKPRKPAKEAEPLARKASSQTKSPLPALATLHSTPLTSVSSAGAATGAATSMKPAAAPARPAGEGLKYASAAAAAAASDKGNVGIAPLPPPPQPPSGPGGAAIPPLPPIHQAKSTSAAGSPAPVAAQPVVSAAQAEAKSFAPLNEADAATTGRPSKRSKAAVGKQPVTTDSSETPTGQANGTTNGIKPIEEEPEEESVYHLPSSLIDLVEAFEQSRKRPLHPSSQSALRMMAASQLAVPDMADAEMPKTYRPDDPAPQAGTGFPSQPLPLFDDPRLYSRMDTDTLFYVFYYRQGTPQQYYAAKALKDQSWRFHKQYQTWFQRHEEPKNITEEFEQGTYRFFDYESTWMNRRKADFKFAYKFLEDEV